MEPPTPIPEDEFEFYFQKAAKNKNLVHIQLTHDDDSPRRGSLPTMATPLVLKEGLPISFHLEDNHHHRASSCRSPNKVRKQIHHSHSARSAKRPSQGEIGSLVPDNGFLSPLSASGDTTVTSTSAPSSRSSSFRKTTREGNTKDENDTVVASTERRRSSVYLEETVAAKLRELKQMEDENCLVVRQFMTSPKGDIIDRVDSFKKKREHSHKAPSSSSTTTPSSSQPKPSHLQIPGKPCNLSRLISCEKPHSVLVVGDRRVGKTALVTQFMTSEYLAALDTSFDTEATDEKTISVSVDGEEMTLQFTDLQLEEQEEHRSLHPEVDCYLLVYSVVDRKSFVHISSLLQDLNELKRTFAVIVVANKSDVVRKRQVPDSDAMDLCTKFSAKFIEVSAALNHKVDELLIGIVNQIRLNARRRQRLETGEPVPNEPPTPTVAACSKGTRGFFARLFSKKKNEPRPCENLQTL